LAAGQGYKGITALMGQPLKLKIRHAPPEGSKADPDLEAFLCSRGLLSFSILIEPLASVGAVRDFLEKKLTMTPQAVSAGGRADTASAASATSSTFSQAQAGSKETKKEKVGIKGKGGEESAGTSGGTGFVYNRFDAMGDDVDTEEDDLSSGRNHFSQDRDDVESSRSLSSHSVCHDYEDDEISSMGDYHEVMRATGSVDSEADDYVSGTSGKDQ